MALVPAGAVTLDHRPLSPRKARQQISDDEMIYVNEFVVIPLSQWTDDDGGIGNDSNGRIMMMMRMIGR